jgi:hypothetical protein
MEQTGVHPTASCVGSNTKLYQTPMSSFGSEKCGQTEKRQMDRQTAPNIR